MAATDPKSKVKVIVHVTPQFPFKGGAARLAYEEKLLAKTGNVGATVTWTRKDIPVHASVGEVHVIAGALP